jgi:hypothetical protein
LAQSQDNKLSEQNIEYGNVFSVFISNDNYITIDDPEYRIEKMYLDGHISPIGWSRNGHFAYAHILDQYYHNYHDDDDYPVSEVVIFNIIDDEIINTVNNLKWYSEPSGGGWGEVDEKSFDEFWVKYRDEIITSLKKYNIIPIKDLKLENIQTLSNKFNLTVAFENSLPEEHDTGWGPHDVYQGKNIIINSTNGKKIVSQTEAIFIGKADGTRVTNFRGEIDFVGYYKYPYGDRIVLYFYDKVFERSSDGKENLSEMVHRLVGCHLTIGFK